MMRNFGILAVIVAMGLSVAWAQDTKKADDPKAAAQDKSDKAKETKQDEPKKDSTKKDEPKKETPKKEAPKQEEPAKTLSEEDKQAIAEFQKLQVDWKNMLGGLRALQTKYSTAKTDEERKQIEKDYNAQIAKGEALEPKIKAAAEGAYLADPKLQRDAERFLASAAAAAYKNDQYEEAARLAVMLAENGYQNSVIYRIAGNASFYTNRYDDAEKYLNLAKDYGSLDEEGKQLLPDVARYKGYWATEQEIRLKEAEAKGDEQLPRVLLKTNKGDITLELFENEAPNTVANFITLVQKGFYKDVPFHRVLSGFMAQGGCPNGDGTGGPGYNIPDECYQENFRRHFRGSLSMAKSVGRDTGGSQFFLCYKQTGHLDGKHTVFGRIIDGMDVANSLQRVDPNHPEPGVVPDRILEAKVLRKRNHEYTFRKTGEEEPGKEPAKKEGEKKEGEKKPKAEKKPDDKEKSK